MKQSLFRGLHLSGSFVLALAMGGAVTLGANQVMAAAEITKKQALDGAIDGTEEGLANLRSYLAQSSGRSASMEERASDLIKSLSKTDIATDAGALQDAIVSISDASRSGLFATPIAKVKVHQNFRLSERSIGFDFGPPDSTVMPHFQHVTAKDKRLTGGKRRALRRPSNDELMADGIANIEQFKTDMPNGKYRVVLLTDNLGIGNKYDHPLGKNIKVNGQSVGIAQNKPKSWLTTGTLSGDQVQIGEGNGPDQGLGKKRRDATRGVGADAAAPAAPAKIAVGRTDKVVAMVQGILPSETRTLVLKDAVYSNEKIRTGPNSATRLIFQDNTVMSVGANSAVTLDKFVFDTTGGASQVSLTVTKGVMRFVTGNLSKDSYSIRTPTATIGIRGTILEVSVDKDGGTTTRVTHGAVDVRSRGRTVRVKAGFTSRVRRGNRPTKPKANPPAAAKEVKELTTALGPEPDPEQVAAVAAEVAQVAAEDKAAADAAPPPAAAAAPAQTPGAGPAAGPAAGPVIAAAPQGQSQDGPATSDDAGADTGGMVIIEVEVKDGKLVIDLDNLGGQSTYLTAIIVEPADTKSNFDLNEEVGDYYQNDRERLADANSRIDEQVGAVLAEIATAAGPEEIAKALDIAKPTKEPDTTASPN
ncbi:MAG: hypothetical protein HOK30_24560 [Rhodospirillaceae bacterium]|nr:hypothetical protein [Rhodospirillaceae bacterium]